MELLKSLLRSSANPDNISLTVKSLAPFIVSLALLFKVDLPEDSIVEIGVGLAAVLSGVGVVYGAGRKIYFAIKNKVN